MLQIPVSLAASLVQMLSLMAVARLIGTEEYSKYSFGVMVGVFIAALASEWLRTILSRQAGNSRARIRTQLLDEIKHVMAILTVLILVLSLGASGLVAAAGFEALGGAGLGIGILASSNVVSDITATYLRFTARQRDFSMFILARALIPGPLTIGVAALTKSGAACVYAFAISNFFIGLVANVRFWPRPQPQLRFRLLPRFVRTGVAMSTSTVAVIWTVTAVRSILVVCLPPNLAGALFVALDLGQRGFTVLGSAISTWGGRLIYDSAHSKDRRLTTSVFRSVSDVSLTMWFSVGMYGACAAAIAPFVIEGSPLGSSYVLSVSLILTALLVLLARIYLIDPLLAAISREREIAMAAVILTSATAAICAGALLVREAWIAVAAAPLVASVSLLAYWARNSFEIRNGITHQTGIYVIIKVAWALLMIVSATSKLLWIIPVLILLAFVFDYKQLRYLLDAYRNSKLNFTEANATMAMPTEQDHQ